MKRNNFTNVFFLASLTITVFAFHSLAFGQNRVVIVPLGGATGDAVTSDVIKRKTFSGKAGKGLTGTLDLKVGKIYTNSIGMEFRLIPAGSFVMGSPDGTVTVPPSIPVWPAELWRDPDEKQHVVILTKSFYIQSTEVTQGQWQQVMSTTPSYFSACGSDCPVEQVSWDDAQNFIDAINANEGRSLCNTTPNTCYSLPTEAQWEYAARAGTVTALYSGDITAQSCVADPNLDPIGWHCGNSAVTYSGCRDISGMGGAACAGTHPVAQKAPNNWGLYDMSGNVYEWCDDFYVTYPDGPVIDPTVTSGTVNHVFRGSSWTNTPKNARSAYRVNNAPGSRFRNLGFRLALPSGL